MKDTYTGFVIICAACALLGVMISISNAISRAADNLERLGDNVNAIRVTLQENK